MSDMVLLYCSKNNEYTEGGKFLHVSAKTATELMRDYPHCFDLYDLEKPAQRNLVDNNRMITRYEIQG